MDHMGAPKAPKESFGGGGLYYDSGDVVDGSTGVDDATTMTLEQLTLLKNELQRCVTESFTSRMQQLGNELRADVRGEVRSGITLIQAARPAGSRRHCRHCGHPTAGRRERSPGSFKKDSKKDRERGAAVQPRPPAAPPIEPPLPWDLPGTLFAETGPQPDAASRPSEDLNRQPQLPGAAAHGAPWSGPDSCRSSLDVGGFQARCIQESPPQSSPTCSKSFVEQQQNWKLHIAEDLLKHQSATAKRVSVASRSSRFSLAERPSVIRPSVHASMSSPSCADEASNAEQVPNRTPAPAQKRKSVLSSVGGILDELEIDLPERITFCHLFTAFVLSDYFDYVISVMLALNAVVIGVAVDIKAKNPWSELPTAFAIFDIIFCVVFTLELGFRLLVSRRLFFTGPDRGWNLFDLLMVLFQVFEEATDLATGCSLGCDKSNANGFGGGDLMSVRIMRLARILRLLRIVRVLRLVRFVGELRKLTYLIVASFWSFIWTMFLLVMLTYIVAVLFTQVVADNVVLVSPEVRVSKEWTELSQYFGTIGDSIHSLYQAIAGGVDWGPMSQLLMDSINPGLGIVFGLYVAFAVLVLLNLVTGVFVDGAMRLTKNDKAAEVVKKVNRAFRHNVGEYMFAITLDDCKERCDTTEMVDLFKTIEINMARAEDLFTVLDEDGRGEVTAEEFAAGSLNLQGPAKALDLAVLAQQQRRAMKTIAESIALLCGSSGMEMPSRISDKLANTVALPSSRPSLQGAATTLPSSPAHQLLRGVAHVGSTCREQSGAFTSPVLTPSTQLASRISPLATAAQSNQSDPRGVINLTSEESSRSSGESSIEGSLESARPQPPGVVKQAKSNARSPKLCNRGRPSPGKFSSHREPPSPLQKFLAHGEVEC